MGYNYLYFEFLNALQRAGGIVLFLVTIAAIGAYLWVLSLRRKVRAQKLLNAFATSLYGKNTVEDIFWDIARNCVSLLEFEDCVIYQLDKRRDILVQIAACGPKNPLKREILNPIEIPVGHGIVGSAALKMAPERIRDTRRDPRYIVDDQARLSELAVPVIVDGEVFAVIDSEHSEVGFYSAYHERVLKAVADICAVRVSRYLVEEQLRARIARDLHDEMGSTLTSITILSEVAMRLFESGKDHFEYLEKIKAYSSGLMESMSDIVWAVNPANDTIGRILIRMKELAAELLEPLQVSYRFVHDLEMDNLRISLEQRKNIYLIYKEALNNLAKYSGASEVEVRLCCEDNVLLLAVEDNGCGFPANQTFSGNGLKNMQARAEEMNAELSIFSEKGRGSALTLKIQLT